MTAHTPGPWHLEDDPLNAGSLFILKGRQLIAIAHRSPANARLIAAAPDLLEALETCADILDSAGLSAYTSMARAAIAKAKGDSD